MTTPTLTVIRGGGHRVLVVEDEADVRRALKTLLRARGYDVLTAKDGREAMEIMTAAEPPCLVILDLMLPWMSGWELAAELQKIERLASIPIVVVSAVSDTAKRSPQVVARIPKPVDMARLYRVIEQHC